MVLDMETKKRLRAAAHPLKPVVTIGQRGYSAAVAAAIDEALIDHELIKVRLRGIEREQRKPVVSLFLPSCRKLLSPLFSLITSFVAFLH